MPTYNFSNDPTIASEQFYATVIAAIQTHKELILGLLSQAQSKDRSELEREYAALYARNLEAYLIELEALHPGFAARVDYRPDTPSA